MLIITMNQWFGPGRNWPHDKQKPDSEQKKTCFATRLPLADALRRVRAYQNAFCGQYVMAIELTLLSVHTIEDLEDDLLGFFNAKLAENLPQTGEELEDDD